ncbi:phosphotransferase [Micromonospora siamensis]|uniref:phosphotransferase n=1 Tax=Micromonospora siamensis TaxID=299152 RepID=UPI001E37090A|nr:phosphotransferase [Micromonospora siamensis]
MTTTPNADRSSQEWRDAALTWVSDALARHGHRITGPVQPRLRPWSLVWRVPTDVGDAWFKANNPGTRYEAGLLAILSRLTPDAVLRPLAVDPERGWTLLPEGGPSLRDVLAGGDDRVARWERVLPAYAELQRTVAPQAGVLLDVGVPDHRPERLPRLLDELLDDRESLRPGEPDGMSVELHERLRAYRVEFAALCRRLDEMGIPATVQHDDLHDGNVFAGTCGYRFFDWGDASVAHPFGTLLVTLRSVAHAAELVDDDPALSRLRDAYLEAWTDRYDRATLRETAHLAKRVTTVSRALSWRRALATDDPARDGYAEAVPGWLGELLAPTLV